MTTIEATAKVSVEENQERGDYVWSITFSNPMPGERPHVPGRPHLIIGAATSNVEAVRQSGALVEQFLANRSTAKIKANPQGSDRDASSEDAVTRINIAPYSGGHWAWFLSLPAGFPADRGHVAGRPFAANGYSPSRDDAVLHAATARHMVDPHAARLQPQIKFGDREPS